ILVAGLGCLRGAVQRLLHAAEVRERELGINGLYVGEWIDLSRHVNDIAALEGSDDVSNGVDLADVREELIAETRALRGTGDQARDVDQLHGSRDDLLRMRDARQLLQAR